MLLPSMPKKAKITLKVYIGWSSCSGTTASTGLYAFRDSRRRLKINHAPTADKLMTRVTKIAKTATRYPWCHQFLHCKKARVEDAWVQFDHERNCNPIHAQLRKGFIDKKHQVTVFPSVQHSIGPTCSWKRYHEAAYHVQQAGRLYSAGSTRLSTKQSQSSALSLSYNLKGPFFLAIKRINLRLLLYQRWSQWTLLGLWPMRQRNYFHWK